MVPSVWLAALLAGCGTASTEQLGPPASAAAAIQDPAQSRTSPVSFELPPPELAGDRSLEEVLAARASARTFTDRPLALNEIGQLLWAAQGVTHGKNRRTTPSAGAKYPLEIYVATPERVLHYLPDGHRVEVHARGDRRARVQRAALGQAFVGQGTALFVIAADHGRTIAKYGPERSPRYVHLEAGHAAHGILLQATALGLGGTPVGGFRDRELERALGIREPEKAVYLVVVGEPVAAPATDGSARSAPGRGADSRNVLRTSGVD